MPTPGCQPPYQSDRGPVHTRLGKIWQGRFISTVRPTVHTNPSRKRSFSKTLFKPEEFENAVGGKHFDSGGCQKRWHHDINVISLPEFSSNTNRKWPVIFAFSNFSDVVRTGLKIERRLLSFTLPNQWNVSCYTSKSCKGTHTQLVPRWKWRMIIAVNFPI